MTLEEEIKSEFDRLQNSQTKIDNEVIEINQSITKFSRWAWTFVFIGLIITGFGIVNIFFPEWKLKLSDYGSFVGGAVASFWSLAGLFFIYVAFLGQRQQLLMQQLEIKFSQVELKSTRLELEGQKKQMIEQNSTLRQQRFENTFFQLVSIHNSIVTSMDLRKNNSKTDVISEGRDCFNIFYTRLEYYIRTQDKNLNIDPKTATLNQTLEAYYIFYEKNQNNLGHYFRNLYHVIKFVNSSDIENKKTYTNFVRAQLSSHELILIFYNCLAEYGIEKFKPLLEKYALLKNMNRQLLFNQKHLNEYDDSAYG